MKKVLVVFGVIVLLSVIFGGDDSSQPASRTTSSADRSAEQTGSSGVQPKTVAMYDIGQSVRLGDFSYTVDKVYAQKTIGDTSEFGMGETASKGAIFVIVDFTIENMSNESATVMTDDFILVDARGRKFSTSSDATTALAFATDQDWILTELQPGLPAEQKTAFMIPENANAPGLHLIIPEKGFFGSGEAKVALVK